MNTLTIILVVLALIVILCAVIYALIKKIKKLQKRNKELETSYNEAKRNVAFLVKHQKEIEEIKVSEGEKLGDIAEAKTDEEIFEIINNVVAFNNSKL